MTKNAKPSGIFSPEYIKNAAAEPSLARAKELATEYTGRKKVKNLHDTSVCARCGEKQAAQVCEGGKCHACGNGVLDTCTGTRWIDYSE
jgi:hypothetical protein